MKKRGIAAVFFLTFSFCFIFNPFAWANNLNIDNVRLGTRNPSANTVVVEFDVQWENSWRNKINHDAIWLTLRLYDAQTTPVYKKLCQITSSGTNPSGTFAGSHSGLELYVPSDRLGAFLRRSSFGATGSIVTQNVQLTVDYASGGFSDTDQIYATVFGMEMVFIPEGAFYAGDHAAGTASLTQGSADTDPWYITTENTITVSNPSANGYRYVSNNNAGESATGSSFSIPAVFPKGYKPFYCMKYEITEGQWIEFFNSLPAGARLKRDLTDAAHKNSDAVNFRNALGCSGSPLNCSTSRPARALSFANWMDVMAFLDWAALRPMTELEYEKIARGPLMDISGEYAWGSTAITAAAMISSGTENGTETITTSGANAHYNNTTLGGGDTGSGPAYQRGPLRSGIFATGSSTRETAGAGYYGVMELSGNVKERVVTIGNATGRSFTGNHGDGMLSTAAGFEGNANVSGWVQTDTVAARGVTGANGSGFKGGSWQDAADRLRISDRYEAALISGGATAAFGGRGVRTYDGT